MPIMKYGFGCEDEHLFLIGHGSGYTHVDLINYSSDFQFLRAEMFS